MQLLEREFQATHRLDKERREQHRDQPRRNMREHLPRTVFRTLAILVRVETGNVLAIPAVYGAVLALWQYGAFDLLALMLAIVCLLCSGWGFNVLQEYRDYLGSLEPDVRSLRETTLSSVSLMRRNLVAPQTVRDLGLILVCTGVLCGLWLGLLEGWPVLFFYGLSLLLASAAVWLPNRYAFWGYGVGELLSFLHIGLLPVLIGYYVQAHTLTWLSVWASLPISLLIMLVYFNYNTIHLRRDWLIHKRTLAVNLGLARALDVSALGTVLAFVGILLLVSLTGLPLIALISLGALPVALGGFADLRRDYLFPQDCVRVYYTTISASTITALLFLVTLVVDRFL